MNRMLMAVAAVCAVTMTSRAGAQERMPSFTGLTVGGTEASHTPLQWYPDRTAPFSFGTVSAFQGRSDVLQIEILGSSPAGTVGSGTSGGGTSMGSNFYALQGYERDVISPGSFTLSADLWVESGWASEANGRRRAEMWATTRNSGGFTTTLPAIGFTNEVSGGSSVGRFRWATGSWAEDWYNLTAPVNYGAWNSLQIQFDASANLFRFYVNGVFQASRTSVGIAPSFCGACGGASTGSGTVIMQTYNYGQSYSVRWSNTGRSRLVR